MRSSSRDPVAGAARVLRGAGFLILLAALLGPGCGGSPRRPNILLITLDTTRADHLGCYGYWRETSPNLDRLAGDGTIYTRAYSTSSWTLPAHASLFTGKLTRSHGARYDAEGPLRLVDAIESTGDWGEIRATGLAPGQATLAGLLGESGYATGAVVAGPWMKRQFGLDAGFAEYDDDGIDELNGRPASEVTDRAVTWIERHADRPFFLFLNYFDPHVPYRPPAEFARRFLSRDSDPQAKAVSGYEMRTLYDAEILFMDHAIGKLIDRLEKRGLYDDMWIIVTADHGELLGEHGRSGHGSSLYEPEVRVPLLVKEPGDRGAGRRSESPAQLTDILPHLLRKLELSAPEPIQGRSLGSASHPVVAELYPLPSRDPEGPYAALIDWPFKLLRRGDGSTDLFDLDADPSESESLSGSERNRTERMRDRLDTYLAGLPPPPPAGPETEVDEETRRQLEGLGYVE